MAVVDLQHLIKRMTPVCVVSLEAAAAIAVRSSQDSVEIGHWLAAASEQPEFTDVMEKAGIVPGDLLADVRRELAQARPGSGGTPGLSQSLVALGREAWLSVSLTYGRQRVHPVDMLLTLLTDSSLRAIACAMSPRLRQANRSAIEALAAALDPETPAVAQPRPGSGAGAAGEDHLGLYTQDMTEMAQLGRLDPVIGREAELRQVIDILLRRRQNNPILVGEAGVGKTAVAEALALRIASGDVPEKLAGVRLLSLDLALLQAGAGVKGEFERRLRGVVDAIKTAPHPVILFIDEAHGLIGAGNQPGQGDAANILKPPLARGELRTLAATTWSEYKRHIEKDPALTRRFQPVDIAEPQEEAAVRMLRGLTGNLQGHHGVRIRDEALRAAVRLSARYIPARQLPDKAISLIDTAAAAVSFGRHGEPARLADRRQEQAMLELERERLAAEPRTEALVEKCEQIAGKVEALAAEIASIEARLAAEHEALAEADRLEDELATSDLPETRRALTECEARLRLLQGEDALVHRVVDGEAIAALVARWTGIPVGRLVSDQIEAVNDLATKLKRRVVGQDAALEVLASAVRVARAGLADPRRPPGVFLMVGLSGVGKTETALALADLLYGGPQSLTVINMSEFKEEHKVSMLLGAPPGYVGFGEGGVLTEAVRRRPYGVLLLDEIDKAHPGVQDVFYQLFDKGSLRDGEGRDVDFKNTTIIMTANTGSEVLAALAEDPLTMPDGEALVAAIEPSLLAQFKPAFLGRTTILPYRPLDRGALERIVAIQIGKVTERVDASYGTTLTLTEAAREALVRGVGGHDYGARAIESMIARDILPILSRHFLAAIPAGTTKVPIEIDHGEAGFRIRTNGQDARSVGNLEASFKNNGNESRQEMAPHRTANSDRTKSSPEFVV